jgi:hypothetical protein
MASPNMYFFSDNIDIDSIVVDKKSLLCVLRCVLNSFDSNNLDKYIDMLIPHVDRYSLSKKEILQLSHVFCKSCSLYKPSMLCTWVKENPELFDTEIFVFDKFFRKFISLKKDISVYPLEDFFVKDRLPVYEQSKSEKLKILNTLVVYYEYINSYQM